MLIETILAAFYMDEILHALRDHFVALNCGRWDYIFSFIKRFSRRPDFVLPDRQQITVTTHFLRSYSLLCIQTCHRRGAMAMGGMAAQIPSGDITEAGLRLNVSVALQYLAAWLSGNGCVPIYHLKEDAATAETSRAQIWQGIRHPGGVLTDGRKVTAPMFRQMLQDEQQRLSAELGKTAWSAGHFERAGVLLEEITTATEFATFLTLPAYRELA